MYHTLTYFLQIYFSCSLLLKEESPGKPDEKEGGLWRPPRWAKHLPLHNLICFRAVSPLHLSIMCKLQHVESRLSSVDCSAPEHLASKPPASVETRTHTLAAQLIPENAIDTNL